MRAWSPRPSRHSVRWSRIADDGSLAGAAEVRNGTSAGFAWAVGNHPTPFVMATQDGVRLLVPQRIEDAKGAAVSRPVRVDWGGEPPAWPQVVAARGSYLVAWRRRRGAEITAVDLASVAPSKPIGDGVEVTGSAL